MALRHCSSPGWSLRSAGAVTSDFARLPWRPCAASLSQRTGWLRTESAVPRAGLTLRLSTWLFVLSAYSAILRLMVGIAVSST